MLLFVVFLLFLWVFNFFYYIKMSNDASLPILNKLALKSCRYMMCWSIPFAIFISTPFALVFCYFNTQNQKKFRLWNVKLFARDLLLFWGVFSFYSVLRTFILDPYCDPTSIHYDKNLNSFQRKKMVVDSMRKVLDSEGKTVSPEVPVKEAEKKN